MKRKVILYLGVSLDGYIADLQGGVGWMQEAGEGSSKGYDRLIEQVDTVLMGGNTYRQIITELSPDEWPYPGKQCYVVTRRERGESPHVSFWREEPALLLEKLQSQPGRDIWVCGGAELAGKLAERDLIDEYRLTLLPLLLGEGIPLFGRQKRKLLLRLKEIQEEEGMVELCYERKRQEEIYEA